MPNLHQLSKTVGFRYRGTGTLSRLCEERPRITELLPRRRGVVVTGSLDNTPTVKRIMV
jgi:hypothetical protein